MKTEYSFAVILAVLVSCQAALGQTVPPSSPMPVPPLVSPDNSLTNTPVADEVVEQVSFDGVALTDAIRTLALQAGLNVEFDPKLLVTPDGHAITPPSVTEKWHKLTAMQALQALLDNWDWQLVLDPRTKVGRVVAKNPAAKEPLVTAVVSLRYANPTNVLKEVDATLPTGSSIIADIRTHQLIIRTTEKELPGVEALITKLDSSTRQVLVEAKLVETSKNISSAKGVDWTGTLQNQHISFGNGLTQGTAQNYKNVLTGNGATTSTVSPGGAPIAGGGASPVTTLSSNITSFTSTVAGLPSQGGGFTLNTSRGISPATAFLNADGVQAVLSFLNTDLDTKTIAFPRSVALDGEQTELAVVQNIPVFEQTQSAPAGGSASGLATIQPNYELKAGGTILNEVGVKLLVTPRIAGPTNVLLDLKPEISQQSGTVTETLNGQPNQAPEFSRTRITTRASVPSGYTLVLGGMDQDVVGNTYTKVPFFGDLPGLGSIFRSDSKTHQSEIVLIFVTPTIISDSDYQPTETQFLKRKPASPSGIRESAWDSGEPYDWTKPRYQVKPDQQP